MRKVLVLVAAVAACDGPIEPLRDDAGGSADPDADLTPDAPPSIDGTWKDSYHTTSGIVMVNACTTVAPAALDVEATTAVTTPYNGMCLPDGSFKIMAPANIGTFYLRVGASLYETTRRAGIDLSTDKLGRNDVAAITGVTLDLGLTNMQSWTAGDRLVAFASNIGYRQSLSLTTGAPTPGATVLNATANWGGYKVDSAKSDALQIFQHGQHSSTSSLLYESLDRVFTVPAFTMQNNTPVNIVGAFQTATMGTVSLSIGLSSFHQYEALVGPSITQKTIQGSLYAAPTPDTFESPSLIAFAQATDNLTAMSYGTLSYRDPFAASWQRLFKVAVGYTVTYNWNGNIGTRVATMERMMPKAAAEANMLYATLSPVRDLKFDSDNALTDTAISPVPLITWTAPALGTPTDYEITVFEAKQASGSTLSFTQVLRLISKETSVRIPSGYLFGQRQYVFSVKARIREGVDVHTTPLRAGTSAASAETLTALVTTDS